jgi:hypothetical protein
LFRCLRTNATLLFYLLYGVELIGLVEVLVYSDFRGSYVISKNPASKCISFTRQDSFVGSPFTVLVHAIYFQRF